MVIQLDCADDESFWETKVNPTLLYIRSNLATCSGRLVLSPSLSLSFFSFLYVTNNGLDLTRLKWLKAAPTSTTVRYDDQLLGSLQTVSIFRFLYSASRVIGNCIQHPSVSRQKPTRGRWWRLFKTVQRDKHQQLQRPWFAQRVTSGSSLL